MDNEPEDRNMNADEIELSPEPIPNARQLLYSPKQVYTGSMLGGPIAASYFIWKNFKTLVEKPRMRLTLWLGFVFSLVLVVILPFLPPKSPNMILPIAYSAAASYLVGKFQRTKQQIEESEIFGFHSNWKVVGVSLLSLVLFIIPAFGFVSLVEQQRMPPHHSVVSSQIRSTVEGFERQRKEKAFIVFAITPLDAKPGDDDVNIEYRIVDGVPTLVWRLLSRRNLADKDQIKQFAEQQGVTMLEVQDSGFQLLFSQDVKIKDLGERIIREFYKLEPSTKIEVFEGQG